MKNFTPAANAFSSIAEWLRASQQGDVPAEQDFALLPRYPFSDYRGVQALLPFSKQFYEITLLQRFPVDATEERGPAVIFVAPAQVFSPLREACGRGFTFYFTAGFLPASGEEADRLLSFFQQGENPVQPLNPGVFDELFRLGEIMLADAQNPFDKYRRAVLQHLLTVFLYKCHAASDRPVVPSEKPSRALEIANEFRRLVELHFHSCHSVTDFARLMDLTPGHLNDSVKDSTGKNASGIIARRILEEARKMLQYSEEDVAAISDKLHFANPSHFGKFFKKATGETPLGYRRRVNKG
ncbi:MAG: AraC family transcriptional regulator [Saprospiraceae bacterium]|nr:AraC family transcriptional regulator [Saprospiraceae bacterium]